jgi:hypothetical protein
VITDSPTIHAGIVLKNSCGVAGAVEELDYDALDLIHNVVIGEDVAATIDDDTTAHATDAGLLVFFW